MVPRMESSSFFVSLMTIERYKSFAEGPISFMDFLNSWRGRRREGQAVNSDEWIIGGHTERQKEQGEVN